MCGIFGIFKKENNKGKNNVSLDIYESLLMLQHRGQDAAGIVTFDGEFFHEKKDNGLVSDVFSRDDLIKMTGFTGIGHVRYPTAGSLSAREAQPFFVNQPFGIFLIHNGNLTNAEYLRKRVTERYFAHLRTGSDSEILLNVLARHLYKTTKNFDFSQKEKMLFSAVKETIQELEGAYSVIALVDKVGLLAFRDPHGIRPLALGTDKDGN